MKIESSLFRKTVIGGLIFLIPFIVALVVLGKAFAVSRAVAEPIAQVTGLDRVGGFLLIDLLALLLMVGLCWLAGHLAMSQRGRDLYQAFDQRLLDLFPRYGFVKSMAESLAGDKGQSTLPVVLVRFDDQSQLGFEVERLEGQVVVYLPGSPDPWSGTVSLVSPERVQPLAVDFKRAVKCIRLLGRGAGRFATPGGLS